MSASAPFNLGAALSRWENEGGTGAEGEARAHSREISTVHPAPPFRLDLTVWALRRRPGNVIDRWDGTSYRRALVVTGVPTAISVAAAAGPEHPHLVVAAERGAAGRAVMDDVRVNIERLLGVDLDLSDFYRMAADDTVVGPLVARFRGLRPPRFPTLFEGLLNAVACQQLSLESGLSLLNRLAVSHGGEASIDGTSINALPEPHDLAPLAPQTLRSLGFSLRKAATIISLSRAVVSGQLDLDGLASIPDDEVVSRLTDLRGIGRWSAEYVMLRGLGRLHIFPGDDVGARKNLARWMGIEGPLD